jgi:translation initiation factor 3 subunit L
VTRLHGAVRAERPNEERIQEVYQESEDVAKEFNNDPWPKAEEVSALVQGDRVFLLLYTEMAFQAFFKNKNMKATMEDRVGSWQNYSALFTALIQDEAGDAMTEAARAHGAEVMITGKWAFDIIYEFVYQFQEACQYRASALQSAINESELQTVLEHKDVWTVDKVFNFLHQLVKVSKVREVLEVASLSKGSAEGEGGGAGAVPLVTYPSKLHYLLGYFALVGLNRLECLLGDFQNALSVAEPVMEESRSVHAGAGLLLSSSIIAQVSLHYHIGLSYLMIRKYHEAIKTFVSVLDVYFKYMESVKQQQRAQQQQQQQQQGQPVQPPPKNADDLAAGKLVDKVAAMLLIVHHLCPGQHIPENIRGHLTGEKMKDKLRHVQSGDVDEIVTLFVVSAPKFISPATDYDAAASSMGVGGQVGTGRGGSGGRTGTYGGLQRIVFAEEVRQMLELRKLRDYLRLYSTIGLEKLSAFTGQEPENIRRELVQYKHKLLQLEASTGSSAQQSLDFHYYLDGDMVHVDAGEHENRQEVSKHFQHEIRKLENLARTLRK